MHEGGVRLFAVGTDARLQRFRACEFLGGERGDMPSQGVFSFDSDRAEIIELESQMISAFGHAAIRNGCAGEPITVDLGAKMLTDEHLPTLAAMMAEGRLSRTHTLSLNACPNITTLPPLEMVR